MPIPSRRCPRLVALAVALTAACGGAPGGGPAPSAGPSPAPPSPSAGPTPAITALDVRGAPPSGGTTIVIDGTGFEAGLDVTFGGSTATSIAVVAGGTVSCVTPAKPAGLYDVVVTNPDGRSATFSNFHYGDPPAPVSFFPGSGAPGTTVTVLGNAMIPGLSGGASIAIGGSAARIVSSVVLGRAPGSPVEDVVDVPALPAGAYQVVVTNPDGQFAIVPGLFTVP